MEQVRRLVWGSKGKRVWMQCSLVVAVCLAGFSADQPNEILQLALPEKLLPPEQQVR